jgi:predicted phage terminase large subunit-like protein
MDAEAAAVEVLRRRKIRASMIEWARVCQFEPALHHRHIISYLERLAHGDLRRLLVSAPPGSAKSSYVSVLWPAWLLANNPTAQIICVSHTAEMASRFSRRTRNIIAEHSAVLGIKLAEDSQSVDRWSLESGGGLVAVGAGGAVVGHRADFIVCDDLLRGREEALSETSRNNIYEYFIAELLTRLRPGGRICLISTRWHLDDIFGRLADTGEYEILNLPAEAEENDPLGRKVGQMLWGDDDYGYANSLRHIKRVQLPANWSAMYMGNPVMEGGNYFKDEWLKPFRILPDSETLKFYITVDFAVTEGRGDYTAICVFAVDPQEDIYLVDVWRRQAAPDESVDRLLDFVRDYKPLVVVTESGQLKNALMPFLKKRMIQRNVHVYIEPIPSRHDKEIRAQSIRGRLAVRGIYLPAQAEWLAAFRSEVLGFPAVKFDDQVDCLSLLGQVLDKLSAVSPPPAEKTRPKIISTDPSLCSVTLTDLFESNERHRRKRVRIS